MAQESRSSAVRTKIERAFADTPSPGEEYDAISATRQDDEGIVEYFRGTSWRGHRVQDLRYHSVALSFFTDAAFRYWLPAFMIAELEDPATADIIAQDIAFSLAYDPRRLGHFTVPELEAVSTFLEECVRRYDTADFRWAAGEVRAFSELKAEEAR